MSSSTGAKWFLVIFIYFAVMTFTVGLIADVSDTSIITSQTTTLGTYCDTPRVNYIAYEESEIVDMESTMSPVWRNYYASNVDCERSLGVRSQTNCESLDGCTWEEELENWWNPWSGAETCTGQMNFTFIESVGTHYVFPAGYAIDDFQNQYNETTNEICTNTEILYNETLCEKLSCDWREHTSSSEVAVGDAGLSSLGKVWKTVKEMATLRFDFGFDNAGLNAFLSLLVFWLPILILIISGYVMVRS